MAPVSLAWAARTSATVELAWNLKLRQLPWASTSVTSVTPTEKEASHCGSTTGLSYHGVSVSSGTAAGCWVICVWRINRSKTAAIERWASLRSPHWGGWTTCSRDRPLIGFQKATSSLSWWSSIMRVVQGHTSWHFMTNQDRNATSCDNGLKITESLDKTSTLDMIMANIHAACNGLAIWPIPDRVRRTSRPKSSVGSMPLSASASEGCTCLMGWDAKHSEQLDTNKPKSPFSWSRCADKPKSLQPQGHALNCDTQAWSAVGATPLAVNMCLG